MIMIIGGAYQGKLAFAKKMYPDITWADGAVCGEEELYSCGGICHFHHYIERMIKAGKPVNDLAEKESYVIVGRCVNYVFKDRPNTLRVFIHAPWEFRVEKASEKISGSREDVEKFLLKDDKRKQEYYRKFAGGVWNDATNYDLCLNSGKLGFEKCVDAIEAQLKIMLNK